MEQLLTPEVAARRLAVSVKTVKNLLRSGTLRGVRVGNLWRLREEALEEYLREPRRQKKKGLIVGKKSRNSEPTERECRTSLGQRLWEIRLQVVASGESLLGWEEIEQEVAERRGETE